MYKSKFLDAVCRQVRTAGKLSKPQQPAFRAVHVTGSVLNAWTVLISHSVCQCIIPIYLGVLAAATMLQQQEVIRQCSMGCPAHWHERPHGAAYNNTNIAYSMSYAVSWCGA